MAEKRVCRGYEVIDSYRIGKTEVVLAFNPNPNEPQQYVTWKAYEHTDFKSFSYGNYFCDGKQARRDFKKRINEERISAGLPPLGKKPKQKGVER